MKWLLGLALSLVSFGASATDLQPFVRGSWGELRAAHKARPMIVHFWGLTCGPCLVELPKWGTFVGQAAGVDVVLIAADPVVVEPADLSAKLTKDGLNGVESWRFADSFTERLEFEIDPHWRGELPYTLLIRSDGTVDRILGAVDFAELQRWIERQGGRAESLQTPKTPVNRAFDLHAAR
jgi:thiol-disulfide isomerase/thioredoxin